MAAQSRRPPPRDWYSISVDSLRRGLGLIAFVLALIGGSLVYQQWDQRTQRDRAERAIADATDLAETLLDREDYDQIRIDHRTAWEDLEDARAELAAERYGPALIRARASLRELNEIFDVGDENGERKSRFLSVQGGVEYRRGERGTWTRAHANDSLNPGDWVKTSADGTAEIRFSDGSTYVLRRDTMVHLGSTTDSSSGSDQVDIRFGWIDLNLAQRGGKVKTPKSEATFQKGTEGAISYDRDRGAGEYLTYEGSAKVVSTSGQTREMGNLQKVEQRGELLSPPTPVPPGPQLVGPVNDQEIDFDKQREMKLSWQDVDDAARYALNVSRSQIFADNIIEDTSRRKTSARVGIRGEGIFYWRVAAIDRGGSRGAWSETRSFRVASLRGVGDVDDTTPPDLVIDEVQTYGSLVLVNGRTETGATVRINGEPVSVQLNGSFSKTIQMTQAGFAFISIVATDAWNNPTEVKRRVFIDAF